MVTRIQFHLRRSRRARLLAGMLVWTLAALACAVSVPPSGGPEDKNPPRVSGSIPRADSTGVDPASAIRIEFSEPMRKERVERLVSVYPPVEIDRIGWEQNTLVIHPTGGLVRDTTYVVRIKPDYQDRHGVPGTQWKEFAFATGTAPLDTARIEGKVTTDRAPTAKAIVRAFRVVPGDTIDVLSTQADREAISDKDGNYKLRYLSSNGSRFVVMAFTDQNSNRFLDRETDPATTYPDTVTILPSLGVVNDVDLALLDPKKPGTVQGTVANESGIDTTRVMVAMYTVPDTVNATYRTVCDSTGAYEIRSVKAGEYVLLAFVDVKMDSLFGVYPCPENTKGCTEPFARRPGTLRMTAGATVVDSLLVIRKEEEP